MHKLLLDAITHKPVCVASPQTQPPLLNHHCLFEMLTEVSPLKYFGESAGRLFNTHQHLGMQRSQLMDNLTDEQSKHVLFFHISCRPDSDLIIAQK